MVLRTKFLPKSKVFFSALRRQNLFLLRKILSGEQRGIRFNVVDERQHLTFCFLEFERIDFRQIFCGDIALNILNLT